MALSTPVPYVPATAPVDTASRGSLLLGFLLGWAVLIGGYIVVGLLAGFIVGVLAPQGGAFDGALGGLYSFVATLPWLALLALIVRFALKNKPRSAIGVALSIVSMVIVAIVLVVLFIAVLASAFHGWHWG